MQHLAWNPITTNPTSPLASVLHRHPQTLSVYTLGVLGAWNPIYRYEWALLTEHTALISCTIEPDSQRYLLQPVGPLCGAAESDLLRALERLPYTAKIFGVTRPFIDAHPEFVARFNMEELRATANYIYSVDTLAELKGSRFSSKRNHISRARREYTWEPQSLTSSDVPECVALVDELFKEAKDQTASLTHEAQACKTALGNLEVFGFHGTVVRVDRQLAAFSVWERQTDDTAVVHFERARRDRHGLYQIICHEAVVTMQAQGYRWVNREEDLDNPGLRKAKMSYHPDHLEASYVLTLKR